MALNNIGNMMKIMNAWNIFKRNHPKFPAFCNAVSKRALKEGSIMAITVTTPDESENKGRGSGAFEGTDQLTECERGL